MLQNRVTNPPPDEVSIGSTTSSMVKETTLPAPVAAHAGGLREALTRPQLRRPPSYTATKALTEAHLVRSGLQDQSTSRERTLNTALGVTKAPASITPDCKHDEDTSASLTCLLVEDNPISLKILEVRINLFPVEFPPHFHAARHCSFAWDAFACSLTMAQRRYRLPSAK